MPSDACGQAIPVQGEIFESGKIKKYPDTSGRCLKHSYNAG